MLQIQSSRPVLLLLLIMALSVAWCAAAEPERRPDVVVVLVDDLRWDELACTGHPFVQTPHIDRIANEGARFRNAFCTTPLCSPVRACLLTGQYTHHHGILDNINRSEASHQLRTFPRLLHDAGYETAFIGKWHMGNDDTARPGFDEWACLQGQGTSFDPVMNVNGERISHSGHTTDVLNQRAVEFVNRSREKPFCLYLSHKALHPELVQRDDGSISDPSAARFLPAKRHERLYSNDAIPRRLNVVDSLDGKPALQREIDGLPALSRTTGTDDETVRDRLRMLAGIDEGVGQLLNALAAADSLDETLFIVASDHGYWYGEHGLSVERRLAYEEAIRIPLLIRYPPLIEPGRLIDEFALSIDLAPTVLELAGVTAPADIDGRSLAPLLRGDHIDDWRTSFLIEYNTDTVFPRVLTMGYKALRTNRWKYIRYNELNGMDELYDLQSDPYEMTNLINETGSDATIRELNAEIDAILSH